jgi:hypothetical protein
MLSEKPWRAESVMLFCAAQFVCLCLGLTLGGVLRHVGVPGFQQAEDFGNIFFATISFQGAAWLLIGFFLRQHQTSWGAAFGWHSPQLKPALFTAVRFIGILLPVILLLGLAAITRASGGGATPPAVVEKVRNIMVVK